MEAKTPKNMTKEQVVLDTYESGKDAADQEDFPETGAETLTVAETDSSNLETEPPGEGDDDLSKETGA
jgi:hypothetical protein